MLISVDRYAEITGDSTSASAVVETAILDAQGLLESELHRPLELAERTERMRRFCDGRVYPSATPITAGPSGSTIYGAGLADAGPAGSFLQPADEYVSVTYTGGFDPAETDRAEVTYVPVELQRAVAFAAQAIIGADTGSLDVPEGATSVSVGDVSISWGPGGSPASGEVTFPRRLVRRWRHRTDGPS